MKRVAEQPQIEDPHTVLIDGRECWFADLRTAAMVRIDEIDRQIRVLNVERARAQADFIRLSGTNITANNNADDEVA
jgi:streptogramin lyase